MKQGQCTKCGTFKSVGAMQGKYCINCATWVRGHKAMLEGNKDIAITKRVPQRTYNGKEAKDLLVLHSILSA